ncbi:MAG: DedA family protein [Bacteroidetes bacterium]|jgi:membrane protein DedA with SNARE-associated domain|nr:DedA family protein [Bacteroidota bacterium]MCL5035385.1 DedA family protein [Bacteroidota bacterium]
METLLREYGYLLIFAITLFEGETVLIIAGILAHQGYLNLELSMLSAFLGSTVGDQIFFQFARQEGLTFVKKFKYIASVLPRAEQLVKRHGSYIVLFSRYIYGLRTALVVMCGLGKMPPLKFSAYNIFASLIWAVSYGFLGYFFSKVIGSFAGIGKTEVIVTVAIAVAAVVYWIVRTANAKPIADEPKQEE